MSYAKAKGLARGRVEKLGGWSGDEVWLSAPSFLSFTFEVKVCLC